MKDSCTRAPTCVEAGVDVEAAATGEQWVEALAIDDLWEGEMIGVNLAGAVDVLLVKLGRDEIHAYDNRCPHAGARLSEGSLSAANLRCGAHLWEFDLRTGIGVNPRNCALRRFPVKLIAGNVWVRIRP